MSTKFFFGNRSALFAGPHNLSLEQQGWFDIIAGALNEGGLENRDWKSGDICIEFIGNTDSRLFVEVIEQIRGLCLLDGITIHYGKIDNGWCISAVRSAWLTTTIGKIKAKLNGFFNKPLGERKFVPPLAVDVLGIS